VHTEIPAWILERRAKGEAAAAAEEAEGPPHRRSPTGWRTGRTGGRRQAVGQAAPAVAGPAAPAVADSPGSSFPSNVVQPLGDFSVSTAESPLITSDLLAFPRNSKALNYMDEPRSPTRVGWSDEPPPPTEEEDGPGPPGAVEHP
jgi:hypothetical protein